MERKVAVSSMQVLEHRPNRVVLFFGLDRPRRGADEQEMPVDFLEQARRYGRYNADPTPAQLSRYFYLDDGVARRSQFGGVTTIGWATPFSYAQARFLGTFLPEPTAVPRVVIAHLAKQLGIAEPSCGNLVNTRSAVIPGNAP